MTDKFVQLADYQQIVYVSEKPKTFRNWVTQIIHFLATKSIVLTDSKGVEK